MLVYRYNVNVNDRIYSYINSGKVKYIRGNTKSIKNWLESQATNVKCVQHIDELEANLLVLPGVGSAKSYMEKLQKSAFDLAIIDHVKNGGRLIGICLGFQIMSSSSDFKNELKSI